MQRKKQIMTNLGHACNILNVVETMPDCGRCADMIRNARMLLEKIRLDITKEKRSAVDWKAVSEIVQFLSRLFSLLKLIVL
jgi:hypothetical protein